MLKKTLNKKLQPIIELYTKDYPEYESQDLIGLYDGRAGTLFLQYMIYDYNKDPDIKTELIKNITILIEKLSNSEVLHGELSTGLAGIGYVFDIINQDPDLDIDLSDFLDEVDEALIDVVKNFIKNKNYDILHGMLGLGLYFLRRGDFSVIETIIEELHNSSIKKDNCIAWNRYDDFMIKENIYDFGLAHGISGIIYFLGKCYKNEIQKDLCKTLINGSIAFLEENEQNFKKNGAYYPNKLICSQYDFGKKEEQFSRFAWCYGDLGILNTLLLVATWTGDTQLKKRCIDKLIMNSSRTSVAETSIEDSGFCHGTSGVSLIYKNCYDLTKNSHFLKTSLFWLQQTFIYECHDFSESSCGHLFVLERDKKQKDISLLAGLGGVLLSYLSYLNAEKNIWKEFFFLQ